MNSRNRHPALIHITISMTLSLFLTGCVVTTNLNNEPYNTPSESMLIQGKVLYNDYCQSCHGPGMKGDGPEAAENDPPPADLTSKGVHLTQTSIKGVLDYPHYSHEAVSDKIKYGNNTMPPLRDVLNRSQIDALTQYVITTIQASE